MTRFKFTQADYDAFDREMADFRAKSQTVIGHIIQCHLIVEYYMNRCLAACYRTMRGDDAPRLTFQQKVDLLPKWSFGFAWIRPGVIHLNKLRNKIAHNIHFSLTPSDLAPIERSIRPVATAGGRAMPVGMACIDEICLQASMALDGWTRRINAASDLGVGAYEIRLYRKEVD